MKTIYKYPLNVTDRQVIAMPEDAEILTVQVQNGKPMLWAVVDPGKNRYDYTIITHGTGHQVVDEYLSYIGTYQLYDGELVFHVFAA